VQFLQSQVNDGKKNHSHRLQQRRAGYFRDAGDESEFGEAGSVLFRWRAR
jgi:hypothetical protein